jgi:hypothetical protein
MRALRPLFVLTLGVTMAALGAACGGGGTGLSDDKGDSSVPVGDATSPFGDDGPGFVGTDAGPTGPNLNGPLAITPANPVIDVTYGQAPATVTFATTINGNAVAAAFAIDRGEIGSIVSATGVLTPSGLVGGTANVSATYGSQRVSTVVTVHLHFVQNGGPAVDDAGAGDAGDAGGDAGTNAGGFGGVGGDGIGGPVDPATLAVLLGTADGGVVADSGVSADGGATDSGVAEGGAADGGATGPGWLYPYDQTVWPRELLAPLLQWTTPQNYDAVFIHLSENAFDYQGFFAKTATPFADHPIPQAAWDLLCNSNQGEPATVTLVFASGGQAYGPITESWTIAQGSLTGTVYYNSYGTNLAHNYGSTLKGQKFGAATLAIKHGATSPELVAGNDSECRVCHTVSADGSRLVTGNGNQGGPGEDPASAWYDLKNGNTEHSMTPDGGSPNGEFNWGALSPDGTLFLNNGAMDKGVYLQGSAAEDTGPVAAQLYTTATSAPYPSTGIPAGLVVGAPVFSPDGTHVAFNFYAGTVPSAVDGGAPAKGDGVSLATMDYDAMSSTFSNFQVVFTPPAGTSVWPSFLPTNDGLVFELETQSNGRDWGGTRAPCDGTVSSTDPSMGCPSESTKGSKGELWWVDLATKKAARLDSLNGLGYLPTLAATDHIDDPSMNYEPTVNPVPSGGYAWVVYTSRRLYGNVATVRPYWSDPRYVDISTTPTTKKLWVAAVSLTARRRHEPPGVLPAGAGAPRRQLARLLGRRPLHAERYDVRDRRPVLRRLLRGRRRRVDLQRAAPGLLDPERQVHDGQRLLRRRHGDAVHQRPLRPAGAHDPSAAEVAPRAGVGTKPSRVMGACARRPFAWRSASGRRSPRDRP